MAQDTHIYGEVKNKNDGVKIQGKVKHMSLTRFSSRAFFVVVACAVAMLAAYSTAQQPESAPLDKLGTVDFPTSGSAQAQAHFLRGVAALHSFWYEVALEEFDESK